ncbi:MAG: YihY family inner membrane protein, partial [Nitrospirae bacterium]
MYIVDKIYNFFIYGIWEIDINRLNKPKAALLKFVRLIYLLVDEIMNGQLTMRAMGLVFTTLLSLVPLLAVAFSMLKAFGVQYAISDTLYNFLSPLGPKADEITAKIIEFVDNIKVGVLGSLGLIILLYNVISVMKKIEDAFNYIWKTKKSRPFFRRFSDYMSVLLVGPVFIYSAIGITASMKSNVFLQKISSIEIFGSFIDNIFLIMPYVFVCAAFTFVYIFIPNTKVQFSSALIGGIVAGFIWQSAGEAFASLVVSSTKYDAIYSGFAILIM